MSWQAYVDSSMVGSGHIKEGAIYSAAGDSKWAASTGFEPTAAEMQIIVAGLNGNTDKLWADGTHIAGEKYVTTKAEDRSIYGRKGRDGIVIVKTKQAILIGHYVDPMIAGNAATTVEQLADYLIKTGY